MKKEYTREEIKKSIECKWRKSQIFFTLGILGIIFLISIMAALYVGLKTNDFSMMLSVLLSAFLFPAIILGPMIVYYLYQYFKIIRKYSKYESYEVLLDRPSTSWYYRGAVYYTVSFVTADNIRKVLDTNPLFSSALFSSVDLNEYNNKKINILYDSDAEKVICIGLNK